MGPSVDLAPLLLLPDTSLDAILGGGLPLLPPLPMSNSMTSPIPSAALAVARTQAEMSGCALCLARKPRGVVSAEVDVSVLHELRTSCVHSRLIAPTSIFKLRFELSQPFQLSAL